MTASAPRTGPAGVRYWLGTYTADGEGTASGIVSLSQAENGTLTPSFAVAAQSPSWVSRHPLVDVVYAAEEFTGLVTAYRPAGATLAAIGEPVRLDAGACHLTVMPDGSALIASCYGSGQVVRIPLLSDGTLSGPATEAAASVDPYGVGGSAGDTGLAQVAPSLGVPDAALTVSGAASARDPHAHQSRVLPDGRVVTTDLGFDLVRVWAPSPRGLRLLHEVSLPYGVGPRHTAWHESGHLHVVTEYSDEVFTLRFDEAGVLRLIAGVQATADGVEPGDNASEISIADRRDRLHVGIRGTNRISTLEVRGDGSELRAIADTETGGDWPRHHLEAGELLHVANQRSGTVTSFRLDERTGVPARRIGSVETGTPTCIARA